MMSPPMTTGAVEGAPSHHHKDTNYENGYVAKTASEEMIGSLGSALEGVSISTEGNLNTRYNSLPSDKNAQPNHDNANPANSTDMGMTRNGSPWGSAFPSATGMGFANANNLTSPSHKEEAKGLFGGMENLEKSSAPHNGSTQQSFDHFLSQSPSKTLGDDLFKKFESAPSNIGKSASALSLEEVGRAPGRLHKNHSPSGSVTGTSVSSRSTSPYQSTNDTDSGSRRTIGAYQPQPQPMPRVGSGLHLSQQQSHGSHHQLHTLESNNQGMYSASSLQLNGEHNGYGGGANFELEALRAVEQQPQFVPQQPVVNAAAPQVLYMAVPTPDGRGQMLQPVQMVQLPGQQSTYVLPTTGNNMAPTGLNGVTEQQTMMLGSLNTPVEHRGGGAADWSVSSSSNYHSYDNKPRYSGQSGNLRDEMPRNHVPHRSNHHHHPGGGAAPTNDAVASLYSAQQRPPLKELLGHVRRLSRDQVGCRLLQQALDEEGPAAATAILNEGLSFWGEAMVDPFGNYLFQKILEKISAEERIMLIKSVSARLVNASLNLHGTRSVQKVVELVSIDEGASPQNVADGTAADILTRSLAPAAARLCIDSHGNHVIQRILLKLSHKHAMFVFDAVAASVGDVARHRHGCCVIQRCLDSPPSDARSHLVSRIVEKSLELMQDAYGNYVVQYVLDVCSDEDVQAVCESVAGKVSLLAIQKFSSNVMEKCLERSTDKVREQYLNELSDPDRIRELMMDPFGNYVVQRALSVATHAQAVALVEAMRPHLLASQPGNPSGQRNGGMRNTAGGRRIMSKICRRFPNFTLSPDVPPEELYSQHKGHHRHHPQAAPPAAYQMLPPAHHHQQVHYGGGDPHHNRGRRHGNQHRQPQPSYYDGPQQGYYEQHIQTGHPGYHQPM